MCCIVLSVVDSREKPAFHEKKQILLSDLGGTAELLAPTVIWVIP